MPAGQRYSTRSSLGSLFFQQKKIKGKWKTYDIDWMSALKSISPFRKRGSMDRRRLFHSCPSNNWLFREIPLDETKLSYSRRTLLFNQRKPPSRTFITAVDISKAFDTVSHRLLIEVMYHFQLQQIQVGWIVPYLRGRKATWKSGQESGRGSLTDPSSPQPSLNPFVLDCPIPNLDIVPHVDDFRLLAIK